MPPPRLPGPRNASPRQTTQRQTSRQSSQRQTLHRQTLPRQPPLHVRPNSFPTRVPLTRPSVPRNHNEIIANSKITPIPPSERLGHLLISVRSIQICIDEANNKCHKDNKKFELTDEGIKLLQAEVTYKLFYLLRVSKIQFLVILVV